MSTTIVTSKKSKAAALALVQALIAGTQKHFPSGSFMLGKTVYTTDTLVTALQGLANALISLNTAHASVKDAMTTLSGTETQVGPLVRDYKRFVLAAFSTATQELADFGLQPPKVRKPLDSDARAVATAKVRSTRAARGTTSKKQKLAIKGNVTSVKITPVTEPTAPAPTATPAEPTPAVPASSGATK
jgi:hypothetical protein